MYGKIQAKLGIIHAAITTVEPIKILLAEILPGCEAIHLVDDALMPSYYESGADAGSMQERMLYCAQFAEEAGADLILEACPSVDVNMSYIQQKVAVPIMRIDQKTARQGMQRARRALEAMHGKTG